MASDNIILRGGNWYVRLSVPADVRPILNRREYTASLKTGSKQEAQRLKLPFLQTWRDEIAEARGLTQDLGEKQRETAYTASQAIQGYLNDSVRLSALGKTKEANEASFELLKELDSFGLDYEAVLPLVQKYRGGDIADRVGFQKELTELLQRQVVTAINPVNQKEVGQILKDPSHYRAKSPITVTRLDAFEDYQRRRGIVAKTVDTQLSRLKKLKAWLEENQRELNHEGVETYLDTLDCANKTKKQHLFAGNSFWKWAIKKDKTFKRQHQEQANPFENQHIEEVRGVRKKERKAFTVTDIQKLHESVKGKTLADLIMLGAYTGARIEELCQLKVSDVVKEDGVDCLYIRDGKTSNAERIVPVHKDLKPLIKRLAKEADGDFLLPASSKNKYGTRSDSLSKQFGRLKKDLGYGEEHVFHSLRKSFITFLQNNDISGLTIASIVGHETGTITFDVYSAGPNAKQKLKAISTLKIL
ncbi:site-specific integrase [Alcanivorax jadensis]|jgi:integrase|uniref:site-specific integrase n=1 Tax=Alcanivorax jadensis TaxID=64988 RepID=UPI000C54B084|nr:site-specific integrase [Alcanivorax jadensis]MBG32962.1 integrase [Alcanivorax sp.]MDF1637697.1 site-specific integrase [Alcanivorax jadensis]|tara:strand:+ start:1547 stop:2968 length:1422 start_codon:yes stop_codon:yes gene_type:complete